MTSLVNRVIFYSGENSNDISGNLTLSGSITPNTYNTYNLGATDKRWMNVYVGNNGIDISGTVIGKDSDTGSMTVKDTSGNALGAILNSLNVQGNIGIGTTVATSKLHIVNYNTTIDLTDNQYPPIALTSDTDTITGQPYGNGTYVCSSSSLQANNNYRDPLEYIYSGTNSWTSWNSLHYYTTAGTYIGSNTVVATNGTTYAGEWWQLEIPQAIQLTYCQFKCNAYSLVLLGSLDGSSWDLVHLQSSTNDYFYTVTITINNSNLYKYIRVTILSTAIDYGESGEAETKAVIGGQFILKGKAISSQSLTTKLSDNGFATFKASIGTNYTNDTVPNDSLIVEGNIGVGTNHPQTKLDVSGNSNFRGNVGIGTSHPNSILDVYYTESVLQNGTIQGVTNFTPNNGYAYGRRTVCDSTGNVFVGGTYITDNVIALKNLDGTNSAYSLPINSSYATGYIIKYNKDGVIQGVSIIGISGLNTGFMTVQDMKMDANDNLYITGSYSSANVVSISSFSGSSSITLPSNSTEFSMATSGYLIKYNSSGTVIKSYYLTSSTDRTNYINSVILDTSNDFYLLGQYSTATSLTVPNFDGTNSVYTLPGVSGSSRLYCLKYDGNGNVIGLSTFQGSGVTVGVCGCVDSLNNFYMAGYYGSASLSITIPNFDGSASGMSLPITSSNSQGTMFIIKYTSSGVAQQLINTVGTTTSIPYSITCDVSNTVYITGDYSTSNAITLTNFDTSNSSYSLPISSQADSFLIKYTSNGNVGGLMVVPGSGTDSGRSVCVDVSRNVYLLGSYSTNSSYTLLNLDSTTSAYSIPTSDPRRVYVIRFDADGVVIGATTFTINTLTTYNVANSISIDRNNNVYITGHHLNSTVVSLSDFVGTSTYSLETTSFGSMVFVIRYAFGNLPIKKPIMYVNDRIGIGTTIPMATLDVSGNVNFSGDIYKNNTIWNPSQWTSSGSSIYYNSGNVGIGSSNPSQTLDVSGNIKGNVILCSSMNINNGTLQFATPSLNFTSTSLSGIIPYTAIQLSSPNGIDIVYFQNVATEQPIFSQNIYLQSNQIYTLKMLVQKVRTATAGTPVSHTISLSFGGTATNVVMYYTVNTSRASSQNTPTALVSVNINTKNSTVVTNAFSGLNEYMNLYVDGQIRTIGSNSAGTFIPNIKYSTAPVTTPTSYNDYVYPGSYIQITPLSSNFSGGPWV